MLHEKLKKLMAGKKDMPANEKKAKMDVVQHLKDLASGAMKGKMGDMKKVSVASNSPEGLQAGLEKAKALIHGQAQGPSDDDGDEAPQAYSDGGEVDASRNGIDTQSPHVDLPEGEAGKGPIPYSDDSHDDMDEDELNSRLEKLMAIKQKRSQQ